MGLESASCAAGQDGKDHPAAPRDTADVQQLKTWTDRKGTYASATGSGVRTLAMATDAATGSRYEWPDGRVRTLVQSKHSDATASFEFDPASGVFTISKGIDEAGGDFAAVSFNPADNPAGPHGSGVLELAMRYRVGGSEGTATLQANQRNGPGSWKYQVESEGSVGAAPELPDGSYDPYAKYPWTVNFAGAEFGLDPGGSAAEIRIPEDNGPFTYSDNTAPNRRAPQDLPILSRVANAVLRGEQPRWPHHSATSSPDKLDTPSAEAGRQEPDGPGRRSVMAEHERSAHQKGVDLARERGRHFADARDSLMRRPADAAAIGVRFREGISGQYSERMPNMRAFEHGSA